MCAIFGVSLPSNHHLTESSLEILNSIWTKSTMRGRDGSGFAFNDGKCVRYFSDDPKLLTQYDFLAVSSVIGNHRAEPTTEYVERKRITDQQPYQLGDWIIVHNGTISNDRKLRTYKLSTPIDSAAIVEQLNLVTEPGIDPSIAMKIVVKRLVGSFAILAIHTPTNKLFVACNYRPIWIGKLDSKTKVFASSRHVFPSNMGIEMLPPYSLSCYQNGKLITQNSIRNLFTLPPKENSKKALVICSGGLDSTVAAAIAVRDYAEVTLIHFQYNCKAESSEIKAVREIAESLRCKLVLFPMPIYTSTDSSLFDENDSISGPEEGAEYAKEWVPARNLVMLSIASAYAEANGYQVLVPGTNLEEAGAYPDNEPEFIDRFNDLLPFAVGDGKQLKVITPVGNMMKHEIVALGLEIGAPLDKTWSCYRNGEFHCGQCGPCFMRRTAFEINKTQEVIKYQN